MSAKKNSQKVKMQTVQLPGHRAVSVGKEEIRLKIRGDIDIIVDEHLIIEFISPICPNDFENGKVEPRAKGRRRKGKIETTIFLSYDAAQALCDLLKIRLDKRMLDLFAKKLG